MSRDSRSRMVRSAATLIRTHGVTATSFSEVLERSGAPRGSIYHHFPNGKEELAIDAVRWTQDWTLAYQRRCPANTPEEVLDWFVRLWREVVVGSKATEGCAIVGVAVDTRADDEELMAAVRLAFDSCIDLLTEQYRAAGVPSERAQSIAVTTVAAMEGAVILCRAERSVRPLEAVAGELRHLVAGPTSRRKRPATTR